MRDKFIALVNQAVAEGRLTDDEADDIVRIFNYGMQIDDVSNYPIVRH